VIKSVYYFKGVRLPPLAIWHNDGTCRYVH